MISVLHVSDLHRTSGPTVHNDELLAAIASDAIRWAAEGIPLPDLIVVSGDIVQGAPAESPEASAEIDRQYSEAKDFLVRLAAEFVSGDRSRVVIVPGNHDVNWRTAKQAMSRCDPCPGDIATRSLEPDSGIRWSWQERTAYTISDPDLYRSRCEQFRRFRAEFYLGLDPDPLGFDEDIVYFDYPALGLVVVGLSSWHGNDCYCEIGEIDLSLVARSRELITASDAPVALAVWHHSVAGGPRARDYMDERVIHRLIDFGFSVGLHGHQHHPGAAPYELKLPNRTSMAVVGAGSLAVGDAELPMGERRQFNIVVIDPDAESVTVHVRSMSVAGVFSGMHRDDFGGETSVTLGLASSPSRPSPPGTVQRLDDAMAALQLGDFDSALSLARELGPSQATLKRKIMLEALSKLDRRDELLVLLDPPLEADELVLAVSLLLDDKHFDEAEKRLEAHRGLVDQGTATALAEQIAARRLME